MESTEAGWKVYDVIAGVSLVVKLLSDKNASALR